MLHVVTSDDVIMNGKDIFIIIIIYLQHAPLHIVSLHA